MLVSRWGEREAGSSSCEMALELSPHKPQELHGITAQHMCPPILFWPRLSRAAADVKERVQVLQIPDFH